MKITIDLDLNEPQKETFRKLKKLLPYSHYVDFRVRNNGEYLFFEADFIKQIFAQVNL